MRRHSLVVGVAAIPVVTDTLVRPDLTPITKATVEIRLFLNGTDGVAYLASSEIFPKVTLHPDLTGLISTTLPANSTLTPANSYYQATFSIPGELPRIETFQVPATAGPFLLLNILVTPPAAGASVHESAADPHPQYATDTDLSTHVAAVNPHPNYATDVDLSTHVAAADPHPGYLTPAEGNAAYSVLAHAHTGTYDPAGTAASAVSTHAGLADPHPTYLTAAEGNAAYEALGAVAAAIVALKAAANTWALAQTFSGQILASAGTAGAPGYGFSAAPTYGQFLRSGNAVDTDINGVASLDVQAASVTLRSLQSFSWSSTDDASGSPDLRLFRGAAATLAQRNGTTPQISHVYSSYTDGSNYGRLALEGSLTSPGIFYERLGSVGAADFNVVNRSNAGVNIGANGAPKWQFQPGGQLTATGNFAIWNGTSALATTATTGFLGVNSCAGPPTGVPASIPTGQIPLVFDSTNKKLFAYSGGSWVSSAAFT